MDHYLIFDGRKVATPFECLNWENAPTKVKKHTKVNPRIGACRLITGHTVHGRTCRQLALGGKASTRDLTWARSHFNSTRGASTDGYIDTDGSMVWCNDPVKTYTWGAGAINRFALHIELVTDENGQMYEDTLRTWGEFCLIATRELGIQPQTPWDMLANTPYAGRIYDCDPERMGKNSVGVIGHRNAWTHPKKADGTKDLTRYTPQRGFGDPNDFPFTWLVEKCGFAKAEFHGGTSQNEPPVRALWRQRQRALGIGDDGVPLTQTVAALKGKGYGDGLWRPGGAIV